MDDSTQNQNSTSASDTTGTDAVNTPSPMQTPAPGDLQPQIDGVLGQVGQPAVDPMNNVQVPDITQPEVVGATSSTGETIPALPTAPDTATDAMQQMASTMPASTDTQADQAMATQSMPSEQPSATAEPNTTAGEMPSLGPVTMEDLMEELQHIEDKLDEMDEKL